MVLVLCVLELKDYQPEAPAGCCCKNPSPISLSDNQSLMIFLKEFPHCYILIYNLDNLAHHLCEDGMMMMKRDFFCPDDSLTVDETVMTGVNRTAAEIGEV